MNRTMPMTLAAGVSAIPGADITAAPSSGAASANAPVEGAAHAAPTASFGDMVDAGTAAANASAPGDSPAQAAPLPTLALSAKGLALEAALPAAPLPAPAALSLPATVLSPAAQKACVATPASDAQPAATGAAPAASAAVVADMPVVALPPASLALLASDATPKSGDALPDVTPADKLKDDDAQAVSASSVASSSPHPVQPAAADAATHQLLAGAPHAPMPVSGLSFADGGHAWTADENAEDTASMGPGVTASSASAQTADGMIDGSQSKIGIGNDAVANLTDAAVSRQDGASGAPFGQVLHQQSRSDHSAVGQSYAGGKPADTALTQGVVPAQHGQIGKEMGAMIARQVVEGRDHVTVRLDPPEMGRIDVRLSFDHGGGLRAVMATESPAAMDLLRRDLGDLTRALADAGVRTDAQSFRFDSRQSGSGFGQPDQRQHGHEGQSGGGRPWVDSIADGTPAPAYRALRTSGRVNIMA